MGDGAKRKNQFGTERGGKSKILNIYSFLTTKITEETQGLQRKNFRILCVFLVPSVVIFYLYGCYPMLILISIFIK